MLNWIVYDNGVEVHRLQATPDFMKDYCMRTGYTCEQTVDEQTVVPEPSADEIFDTLLGGGNR